MQQPQWQRFMVLTKKQKARCEELHECRKRLFLKLFVEGVKKVSDSFFIMMNKTQLVR